MIQIDVSLPGKDDFVLVKVADAVAINEILRQSNVTEIATRLAVEAVGAGAFKGNYPDNVLPGQLAERCVLIAKTIVSQTQEKS